MRNRVDMEEMANMMNAIVHYGGIPNYFAQLGMGETSEGLENYWNTKIVKRDKSTWMTQSEYEEWKDINLHLVSQMWSNTSCGWEGIGGSAMSSAYTLIIESKWFNLVFVYYRGKLAYICENDEKYESVKQKHFIGLPGYNSCLDKLTVIYRNKIR